MRKKKHAEHVNHERWLVSYADFITLLFAFFVVMFAVSKVDSKQVGRFTESFSEAVGIPIGGDFGRGVFPGARQVVPIGDGKRDAKRSELDQVELKLKAFAASHDLDAVTVLHVGSELVLRFAEAVTFASGDVALKEPALRALRAIAETLRDRKVNIRVEGHTDDVPINTARFRSNWELSTARATVVVLELAGPGRIDPHRLAAAGYGEFQPIAPNSTPEQRAQNRRVDIVVTEMPAKDSEASSHEASTP